MRRRIVEFVVGTVILVALALAAGCGASGNTSTSFPDSGGGTTSGNVSGSAE